MLTVKTSLAVLPELDPSYVNIYAQKMWTITLDQVPHRPNALGALTHRFIYPPVRKLTVT